MAKRSMFMGMDVHKESIDVSLAEEGRSGEVPTSWEWVNVASFQEAVRLACCGR